jgi:hypothetical protein
VVEVEKQTIAKKLAEVEDKCGALQMLQSMTGLSMYKHIELAPEKELTCRSELSPWFPKVYPRVTMEPQEETGQLSSFVLPFSSSA